MNTELKNEYIKKLNRDIWASSIKFCIELMILGLLLVFDKPLFLQVLIGIFAARNLIGTILTTIVISKVVKNKVIIISEDDNE